MPTPKNLIPIVVCEDGLYLDMGRLLGQRTADQGVVADPAVPWSADEDEHDLPPTLSVEELIGHEQPEVPNLDVLLRRVERGQMSIDETIEAVESELAGSWELYKMRELRSLGVNDRHIAAGIRSGEMAGEELAWWKENRHRLGSLSAPKGNLFDPAGEFDDWRGFEEQLLSDLEEADAGHEQVGEFRYALAAKDLAVIVVKATICGWTAEEVVASSAWLVRQLREMFDDGMSDGEVIELANRYHALSTAHGYALDLFKKVLSLIRSENEPPGHAGGYSYRLNGRRIEVIDDEWRLSEWRLSIGISSEIAEQVHGPLVGVSVKHLNQHSWPKGSMAYFSPTEGGVMRGGSTSAYRYPVKGCGRFIKKDHPDWSAVEYDAAVWRMEGDTWVCRHTDAPAGAEAERSDEEE